MPAMHPHSMRSGRGLLAAAMRLGLLLLALASEPARAVITYVGGASNASSSAASSLAVSLPSGTVEGDVMVALVSLRGNRTITAPSGWSSVLRTDNSSGSNIRQQLFVKVATGAEPASFTFSFSGSERCAVAVLSYRGVDSGAPVDAVGGQANTASSSSVTAPSITATVANARIVGFFAIANGNATLTAPGGMTAVLTTAATTAGPNGVAVLVADAAAGVAGATGGKTASASHSTQSVGQLIALRAAGGLVACYSFEEASWNGTAGEVIDGQGTYSGRRLGAAQSTASGKLSRGAGIPSNSSTGTQDAVLTPLHITDHVGNAGTITFWYKSNAAWSSGGRRTLLDASTDTASAQRFFYVELDTSGDLEFGLEDSAGNNQSFETSGLTYAAVTWVHVAVTWRLPNGTMEIYLDGTRVATRTLSANNLNIGATGYLHIGDNSSTYTPLHSGSSANGVIDEVRVYNTVRTSAQINADKDTTTTCGEALATLDLDVGAATGSTCAVKSIALSALKADGTPYTGYTGTVNLSTSTGSGDWSLSSGGGSLNNGSADDGAATYTFVAADNGAVTLGLSEQQARTLSVTATDSAVTTITTTSAGIAFSDNTFVFSEDLSAKIAGSDVAVAGRAHDFQVALYRRDAGTGSRCGIATGYSGSKALKAWITRSGDDPGGAAPAIAGVSLGNAQPGSNNLGLSFSAGVASFSLSTTDVGQYALNLRDDTTTALTAAVSGSSDTLTVRPFALVVSAIRRGGTSNPNTSSATGTVFTQAGESFQATVGAYLHASAADSDDDGVPDSGATLTQTTAAGLTPSYAFLTTLAAAAPFAPAAGTLGALGNGALAAAVFSGGAATPATLTYAEVGSFSLTAAVSNYLNAAGVDLTGVVFSSAGSRNAVVGRFTPYDFGLSLNTPAFAPGCAIGTAFTYVGQAFSFGTAPVIAVTARNKAGATTRNYTGAWWKLSNSTLTGRSYTAASGTLNTTGLPATTADPVIVDVGGASGGQGTLTFSSGSGLLFTRAAPVAPFNADIALSLNVLDSDGVAYGSNPARFGAATSGNGIAFTGTGGGKAQRWGRLKLSNGLGTEFADLLLPLAAQYYNGTSFIANADDGCTSLGGSAFLFTNFQRNLSACETHVAATPVTLSGGKASIRLRAPGSGNNGSVDLKPALSSADSGTACVSTTAGSVTGVSLTHLRSNWDAAAPTAYDKNPTGRAVFGIPRVPKEIVFVRENY